MKLYYSFLFRVILFICFSWKFLAFPQTTNISGTINVFSRVTAISQVNCHSVVAVDNPLLFSVGDKVMIIQMKGAIVDSSNTNSFGNVLNLNNSGNYEFADVASVIGNDIHLTGVLSTNYIISGFVQLVRVPVYVNAYVTAPLTTQDWNGQTGGVIAFFASGTLTLNADIDATGKGFRGGNISNNPDGGCGTGSSGFFYPSTYVGGKGGAMKGEGIAVLNSDKMFGKGNLANGGGGGNKHNHGGGGGGNFTSGGLGGESLQGCPIDGNAGVGGLSLSSYYSGNRLFLGGGGGCGDYNDGVGSNGADGGGIIVIRANTIIGNSRAIRSSGDDETIIGGGFADGVGGGGGGGTILLDVQNYSTPLNAVANGGDGGDQNATYGCVGTGGGGGTGIIMTSRPSLPANVTSTMIPGTAGIFLNTNFAGCAGTNYYATNGATNGSGIYPNVEIRETVPNNNAFTFSLGSDTTICQGQSVVLNAGSGYSSYLWQDGSSNQTFTTTLAGNYSCTVTNTCGSASDAIQISVINPPAVWLGNDTTICLGQNVLLDAGSGFVSYLWQDGSSNQLFTAISAGNYSCTVTNDCGTASDIIQISVISQAVVSLGNDTSICSGQSVVLDAGSGFASYLWQNGSSNQTFTAVSAGNYSCTVTSSCSTVSDAVQISVINPPYIFLGNDTSVCSNQNILLDAGSGFASYLWQDGTSNQTFLAAPAGNYSCTVSNNCGTASDALTISELFPPVIFLGNDTAICSGQSVLLDAGSGFLIYNWNNGLTNQTLTANTNGNYSCTVTNTCGTVSDAIAVFVNPLPLVDLGTDTTICEKQEIFLNASCEGCSYVWQDFSTGSVYRANASGIFSVTVSNNCGTTTDEMKISIESCECIVFIPNAFTPNGDGNNDFFVPAYNCSLMYYRLSIFNRWGEKVFESLNPNSGWNGRFKNSDSPAAVYVYVLKYSGKVVDEVESFAKKGTVTLIR